MTHPSTEDEISLETALAHLLDPDAGADGHEDRDPCRRVLFHFFMGLDLRVHALEDREGHRAPDEVLPLSGHAGGTTPVADIGDDRSCEDDRSCADAGCSGACRRDSDRLEPRPETVVDLGGPGIQRAADGRGGDPESRGTMEGEPDALGDPDRPISYSRRVRGSVDGDDLVLRVRLGRRALERGLDHADVAVGWSDDRITIYSSARGTP